MFDPVHVRGPQAQFLFSGPQDYLVLTVKSLQLFRHLESSVWRTIVDHDNLVGELAVILHSFA